MRVSAPAAAAALLLGCLAATAAARERWWKDPHARHLYEQGRRETEELHRRERQVGGDGHFLGITASLTAGYGMVWCAHCRNPHAGGAFAPTFESAHNPRAYHVDGELVLAVPLDASTPLLDRVGGALVLAERGGGVSLAAKARHAQEAGALGLVVVDAAGECGDELRCGGALGDKGGDDDAGFGLGDTGGGWETIFIPVVLVSQREGERLRRAMAASDAHVDSLGAHVYSIPPPPPPAVARRHQQ